MSKKLSKMSIAALVIAFSVAGSARAGDITGITGNGGVFNINPATINGEAGLREYTNFRLDQGEVANLIFKYGNQDISKFVNLVDNQININGLVNTVRNGQFYPGEAIFVSPNGMVVGESGVLNVGSLSVLTPTAPGMKMYKNGKATLEELGYHGNSNITINGMVLARNNVGMVARDLTVGPTGSVIAGMGTGYNSLVNNSQQAADLFNQLVNTGKNSSAASVEFRTYNRDGAGTNGMNIQGDVINHGSGDIVMINRGKEFNTSNGNITAHGGDVYLTNGSGTMNLNNKVTADSIYIAGGSEAVITHIGIGAFATARTLSRRNDEPERASRPYDIDRDGFVMGEGGACLILEELNHAKARGAKIYAEIVGYGQTADAYDMVAPDPSGAGAAKAMELAVNEAGVVPKNVGYINAHGTSTHLGDIAESQAIARVFGDLDTNPDLKVSSTKSMHGHMIGATGATESIVCIKVLNEDIIPPTINLENQDPEVANLNYVPNKAIKKEVDYALTNSFGFGGQNASILFKRYED